MGSCPGDEAPALCPTAPPPPPPGALHPPRSALLRRRSENDHLRLQLEFVQRDNRDLEAEREDMKEEFAKRIARMQVRLPPLPPQKGIGLTRT